jgi:hypothetical protein
MSDEPEDTNELSPKEKFRKTSHIALLIAYDLIDKLRYWEKQTLELPDEQIEERQEHLVASIEQLRVAYLDFTDFEG